MDAPKYRGFEIAISRKGGYIALRYGRIMYRARTENDLHDLIDQTCRR